MRLVKAIFIGYVIESPLAIMLHVGRFSIGGPVDLCAFIGTISHLPALFVFNGINTSGVLFFFAVTFQAILWSVIVYGCLWLYDGWGGESKIYRP